MPVRGKTAGNKGQGSKWISRKRRIEIYSRDGFRCRWCKERVCSWGHVHACGMRRATLDHIVARSAGGTNESSNLITACMHCNRERGNRSLRQYAAMKGRQLAAAILKAVKT